MANAQDRVRPKGRGRARFFAFPLLALICGLGFAFLQRQAIVWNQDIARPEVLLERQPERRGAKLSQATVLVPSFDIASVDERGTLVAAGRSEAGWIVQLKSKSQILGETKADENNEWVLNPEAPLPPGEHTLSLLAIDPSGQQRVVGERDSLVTVVAPRRAIGEPPQTPVQMRRTAAPSPEFALTRPAGQNTGKCASTVVKTGDTLWGIARHCYGIGTKYTKIFRSNRALIRDPDLIYPDQRLALPR